MRFRLAAAFAAIYLVWGSTYLAIALALPAIPPFTLMGSRSLAGGLVLFGLARARGARPGWRDWLAGAACGLLFFVGCHGVLAVAEQRVPSGLASILLATIPFWTALIGLVLPLEKPTRPRTLLLLVPGFAGVALIAWRELAGAGPALTDMLMLLGAAMSWALGSVVSERQSEVPAAALSGMALISGGLVLLGLAAATGEWRRVDPAGLAGVPGLAWAHLTLLGTIVTFGAYVWLLERVSPPLVATYTFVNPIVAVALGWAVLGEAATPEMLAGGALVLGSLVALLMLDPPEAKRRRKEESHVPVGARC
ncbi:EamA family transporter [Inquilinus limosus]|uniref:EamA family transporter n=1 Tax=Inquilinus limosus TaxID=171674 RepID=UPI00040A87E8|nr:EamA family transporter [Inquilinus limosus]